MVAEIWASVISSFVDQLVACLDCKNEANVNAIDVLLIVLYTRTSLTQ